jgi:coniferyl-aldehyde dehydrogenase
MAAEVETLKQDAGTIADMQAVFEKQKAASAAHPYPSAEERINSLLKLKSLLADNIDAFCDAANKDFGSRSADETKLAEIITSLEGIKYYKKHLKNWMKPVKRKVGMAQWPGSAAIVYQPVGVVGVIVPWNYPIYLGTGPLTAALAAGNRVMIKMSEFTPHVGELLARLIAKYFPPEQVAVFNGEVEAAQAFSKLAFDHLLFTGSSSVGKHIMRAAADNLTPVTLELGGKSPCIIGEDFAMKDAIERISFGKCLNAGQTCVAPDYVLCPANRIDDFVSAWKAQVSRMYPSIKDNPDVTSVINERQYERLQSYLKEAREKGASIVEVNPQKEDLSGCRKIPSTLVLNATDDMKIMQEEIFGPLMIVIPYQGLDNAIRFINERPRPLALYYLDWNKRNAERVLRETHSGGVCLNDTVFHVAVDDLPFGGIGNSGMGHYHGKEGFLTFSHAKSIYHKGRINATKNMMPPFGGTMLNLVYKMMMR